MRIREAKKSDAAAAAQVLLEGDSAFETKKRLPSMKRFLTKKTASKECLVAEYTADGGIIGVIVYTRDYSHDAHYIEYIATAQAHRRKGVARALLRAFIARCKKETPARQRYALSSTTITNRASIAMHHKAGFERMGTLKGLHYGTDEMFFRYRLK